MEIPSTFGSEYPYFPREDATNKCVYHYHGVVVTEDQSRGR